MMARPARVALVVTRLARGGAAKVVLHLAAGLMRHGFDVTLIHGLTGAGEEGCAAEADSPGLRRVEIPGLGREVSPLRDIGAAWRLYRLLRREQFDVIHTHTSKAGALGRLAGRLAGIRVIVHTAHGHIYAGSGGIPGVSDRPVRRFFFLRAERWLAGITDGFVALSDDERAVSVRLGLGDAARYRVVYHAIPAPAGAGMDADAFRREFGIAPDAPVVGCAGRLTREKGVDVLLRAFAAAGGAVFGAWLLILGNGPERENLRALAAELGIAGRVVFAGMRADAGDILPHLDLYVSPSRYEGFGQSILEAMAAGVPVVATRVGGVPELLGGGRHGLLVPPDDPAALGEAMASALGDAARIGPLAASGREAARRLLAVDFVAETAAFYRELLSR
ncbi:MAG: glycosyltransferase [Planctomycetota bacterium]